MSLRGRVVRALPQRETPVRVKVAPDPKRQLANRCPGVLMVITLAQKSAPIGCIIKEGRYLFRGTQALYVKTDGYSKIMFGRTGAVPPGRP